MSSKRYTIEVEAWAVPTAMLELQAWGICDEKYKVTITTEHTNVVDVVTEGLDAEAYSITKVETL